MPQSTRRWIAHKVDSLRHAPQLPFHDLLNPDTVQQALDKHQVTVRERIFTPVVTLWTFLSQVLSPDHSCREAVARLIAFRVARGQTPCAPETGSYCKARQRLPLPVLTDLVRRTAQRLDEQAPDSWTWKGRRVQLVDGTTVSMPDTAANQAAFPQPRSQKPGVGFPLARLVAVISLTTGALRELAIGPYRGKQTGETALFRALWDRLDPGDIVLGDRTFSSFFGIAPLVQRGVDGLFRMHRSRRYDFRRGRRLGVTDHVVRWTKPVRPEWMDEALYAQMPDELVIRELRVKVQQDGFRVDELVLVTTLVDPVQYTKEEVADLFLRRWNIELDLRSIKCVLQMDVLRCETPEMVEKEIWMHLLAYNLIRSLMARAAEAHEVEPRRLSFKGALQALGAFRESLQWARGRRRVVLWEELLHVIATHEVGDRPDRVEPRAKKRRPKPHRLLKEPREQARKRLLKSR
jgi:Transposase DDE domain/Insertion element 4 transposase N-terminal